MSMTQEKNAKSLTLTFVESGSTELHDQGRICGSIDIPLSETGIVTANRLSDQFAAVPITTIFSAACLAAQQTAKMIAAKCRGKVKVIDSWRNLNHGLWHGKSVADLKETHPKFYRQWRDYPESVAPPEGETYSEVMQRCRAGVERIKKKNQSSVILVVAPQPLLKILEDLFNEAV